MFRAIVIALTASLVAATNITKPLAPYVFVAGVEGTGHHWFTSCLLYTSPSPRD